MNLNKKNYLKKSKNISHFKKCYICHKDFEIPHSHYNWMCKACGDFNYEKRTDKVNLKNYVALVTGGRIKIGFQSALKLLRNGAFVIITSRFPVDSVLRFSKESDFEEWRENLRIYKIDFRNIQQVEEFIGFLNNHLTHLDILINNAAQTVRKPIEYYLHLEKKESTNLLNLPDNIRQLIYEVNINFNIFEYQKKLDNSNNNKISGSFPVLTNNSNDFPVNELDKDDQQVDLRRNNSWNSKVDEISTLELLETQLINVTTPYVLVAKLKGLMNQSPHSAKYIINVSAMEGKFNRRNKNSFHPHTNMAKAALNMLTRTSAQDYLHSKIFMNSVDTGWITDENPAHIITSNISNKIIPPLDEVDGAARICDPIFYGIKTGRNSYGRFFKDYHLTDW